MVLPFEGPRGHVSVPWVTVSETAFVFGFGRVRSTTEFYPLSVLWFQKPLRSGYCRVQQGMPRLIALGVSPFHLLGFGPMLGLGPGVTGGLGELLPAL